MMPVAGPAPSPGGLSVCRIGDQLLFRSGSEWYAMGYYQLAEIAELFGERLGRFTVFGRVLGNPPFGKARFRIPKETVRAFGVAGLTVSSRGATGYIRGFTTLIGALRRVAREHDVLWHMLPSISGLLGLLVTPRGPLRVAQVVGQWEQPLRAKYPFLGAVLGWGMNWATKLALSRADLRVYVSEHLRSRFGYDGIVANESRLRSHMVTWLDRSEMHTPLRVLYAGRLVPEKGVHVLFEAVRLCSLRFPCELWVAGEGPFECHLRALAGRFGMQGSVKWLGWVAWGEEMFRLMRQADLFVLPSFPGIEGLPLVLVEAMSQSLPVIASATDGILELVQDGVTGLLFPPGNSRELARCIRRLAEDKDLRLKLVTNGLQVALHNTLEAQTGRVVEAICQLFKEREHGGKDYQNAGEGARV